MCVSVFVCARLKSLTLPFRLCSDRGGGGGGEKKNMFPSRTKRKKETSTSFICRRFPRLPQPLGLITGKLSLQERSR